MIDIEDQVAKLLPKVDIQKLDKYINFIIERNPKCHGSFERAMKYASRQLKIQFKKTDIIHRYRRLIKDGKLKINQKLNDLMITKLSRKTSGVIVITVLTSPYPSYVNKNGERITQKFSCGENCAYCPHETRIDILCEIRQIEVLEKYKKLTLVSFEEIPKEFRVITYLTGSDKRQVAVLKSDNYEKYTFNVYISKQDYIDGLCTATKVEQPRSYISTEPAVRRANKNNFDAIKQFNDRALTLYLCGMDIDKIELLVLGGTWSHYPKKYQEEFIRDLYYAANVFYSKKKRKKKSLVEEISYNEISNCRIIGLTLETRPDCINVYEIKRFREYGCTRVQLGVQHINDDILKKINRGCYTKHTIKAIYLLKQNCFKVDIHLMPDLYGSSLEKDKEMFDKLLGYKIIESKLDLFLIIVMFTFGFIFPEIIPVVLYLIWINKSNIIEYKLVEPRIQADQWKIYPTETTLWTKILELYNQGKYRPYAEEINRDTGRTKIVDLLLYVMPKIFPWIRVNRVIRDIPTTEIIAGNAIPSLRSDLDRMLKEEGKFCKSIRNREVKNKKINKNNVRLVIRKYNDNNADEYFISFESKDLKTIYGFCRLRLSYNNDGIYFYEIRNCAKVRELHVYGQMTRHDVKGRNTQHMGFGKKLMKEAEKIAKKNGFSKICVISGVGVRKYYYKLGYRYNNTYMVKEL